MDRYQINGGKAFLGWLFFKSLHVWTIDTSYLHDWMYHVNGSCAMSEVIYICSYLAKSFFFLLYEN
jgi:hypothetical protein